MHSWRYWAVPEGSAGANGETHPAGQGMTIKPKSAPHADRNKILRQGLRAMIILRAGRWTMAELADELGVGWRTAYRIVDGIRDAGIPVEASGTRGRDTDGIHYRITASDVRKALKL